MTLIRVLEHHSSNSLSVIAALRSMQIPCEHVLPEVIMLITQFMVSHSWSWPHERTI